MLFSGQDAFGSLIKQGPTLALSTLAFLLLFKGLAWSISLGSFRGGPTFPALFIGAAGGLSPRTCQGSPRPRPWPC